MALQADHKVLISGPFTNYNGTPRGHIARLNADLDAGVHDIMSATVRLDAFPNPTSGSLQLKAPEQGALHLQVHDVYGRVVMDETRITAAGQPLVLNVGPLSSGTYFLELHYNTGVRYVAKLMRE